MFGRIYEECPDGISGLTLGQSEEIVQCFRTRAYVRNPLMGDDMQPEMVVVTNERLVVLERHSVFNDNVTLTVLPLDKIESVQATYISWTVARIIYCVLSFICYLIPGIIFLIWMNYNKGAIASISSGDVSCEIKCHPRLQESFRKIIKTLSSIDKTES